MVGTLLFFEQRQWIDVETQESNDPYCFQVSKFITRLVRHSQKVYRQDDGAVHDDQVIVECKKKQSDNTGYWSDEMKKHFVNAQHWSIENGYKFWYRWRTKEKVSILLESELPSSIPVPSGNPRTFRKYNQSCIARQWYCYQKVLSSIFTTSKTEKHWGQWWTMVWFQ